MKRIVYALMLVASLLLLASCYYSIQEQLTVDVVDFGSCYQDEFHHVVSMSCNVQGATLYYSTDGCRPDIESAVYHEDAQRLSTGAYRQGIVVPSGCDLVVVAVKSGYKNSEVERIGIGKASINNLDIIDYGEYYYDSNYKIIGFSSPIDNVTFHYSIYDNWGTTDYSVYFPYSYYGYDRQYHTGILVRKGENVSVYGTRSDCNDSWIHTYSVPYYTVQTPTISDNGLYVNDTSKHIISMSSTTSNSTIRYTIDGSAPTSLSTYYSPSYYNSVDGYSYYGVLVDSGVTIRAIGTRMDYSNSGEATFKVPNNAAIPTIIDNGVYSNDSSKHIISIDSTTTGATIRYTTDGNSPTSWSSIYYPGACVDVNNNVYNGILVESGKTVKAIAIKSGYTNSPVSSFVVPYTVSTPEIIDRGIYSGDQSKHVISISCLTSGASIMYSTDGSTPGTGSNYYSAYYYSTSSGSEYYGILVPCGSILKAIGTKSGYTNSIVASYSVPNIPVNIPTILDRGTYYYDNSYSVVEISCVTPNTTIKYTLDGNEPNDFSNSYNPYSYRTTSGEYYNGILVSKGNTVKAYAKRSGYMDSEIASMYITPLSRSYTVNLNSQWRSLTDSSVTYDSSVYSAYESYSNYHVNSSTARMSITISGYSSFSIRVMSDAESSFDYVKVYNIDSTSSVKLSTSANQRVWQTVTFSGISFGSHTITIDFVKDGSQHSGRDRGFVLVPRN